MKRALKIRFSRPIHFPGAAELLPYFIKQQDGYLKGCPSFLCPGFAQLDTQRTMLSSRCRGYRRPFGGGSREDNSRPLSQPDVLLT